MQNPAPRLRNSFDAADAWRALQHTRSFSVRVQDGAPTCPFCYQKQLAAECALPGLLPIPSRTFGSPGGLRRPNEDPSRPG